MSLFDRMKRLFGANGAQDGIACHDALRLVHEFLDGELEDVTRAEVEAHFEMCKRCYPHLNLERRFRTAVQRACATEAAPPELRNRVMEIAAGGSSDG